LDEFDDILLQFLIFFNDIFNLKKIKKIKKLKNPETKNDRGMERGSTKVFLQITHTKERRISASRQ
jgi:hypothetical protein